MGIHINKKIIYFQIINELSAWNDYICSKEAKNNWLKESGGQLKKEEKEILDKFSLEMRKGPDEAAMKLLTNINWQELRKKKGYKDLINTIFQCIKILEPRLNKLYKKYLKKLKETESKLKKDKKELLKFQREINKFLEIKKLISDFEIIILLPKNDSYEAWVCNKNKILLIPSKKDKWQKIKLILLHEYTHLLFRNSLSLNKKIAKGANLLNTNLLNKLCRETGLWIKAIIEELFISSLIPEGRLGKIFYPKIKWLVSKKADKFEKLRNKMANLMKNFVDKRYKKEIKLKDYWEEFYKNLKKLK